MFLSCNFLEKFNTFYLKLLNVNINFLEVFLILQILNGGMHLVSFFVNLKYSWLEMYICLFKGIVGIISSDSFN